MSQRTWTYIDDHGFRHRIGLFHGDQTRHLMVYCDAQIVIIDFAVTSAKNYSFFINEDLMDIEVGETDGNFSYAISLDEKSDTPKNRWRKEQAREERQHVFFAAVIMILFISGILYLLL